MIFRGVNRHEHAFATGHEIYHTQFFLGGTNQIKAAPFKKSTKLIITENQDTYTISGASFKVRFDKKSGLISGYEKEAISYLTCGALENLSRPQSGLDTEIAWGIDPVWRLLRPTTLQRSISGFQLVSMADGTISAQVNTILTSPQTNHTISSEIKYLINDKGSLIIDSQIDIDRRFIHVPRVGIGLVTAPGFNSLEWYGRGPGENYRDRKEHTLFGRYQSTVAAQHFAFIPPSECGGHEDTSWIILSNGSTKKITVTSPARFHFDARHSSIADYQGALHDHELIRRAETFLNLDCCHAGLGSDMGWATVLPDYAMVQANCYQFRFIMDFE